MSKVYRRRGAASRGRWTGTGGQGGQVGRAFREISMCAGCDVAAARSRPVVWSMKKAVLRLAPPPRLASARRPLYAATVSFVPVDTDTSVGAGTGVNIGPSHLNGRHWKTMRRRREKAGETSESRPV